MKRTRGINRDGRINEKKRKVGALCNLPEIRPRTGSVQESLKKTKNRGGGNITEMAKRRSCKATRKNQKKRNGEDVVNRPNRGPG